VVSHVDQGRDMGDPQDGHVGREGDIMANGRSRLGLGMGGVGPTTGMGPAATAGSVCVCVRK
jgi:hypothetical protein